LKNNSLFRRSLVYGIILLFIGLSVTPSISGYIEKISNQPTRETPTNFPLNNDYTHAYWKFDEGNGNIAYDSSGNDYDGTIYGATWTTDTPSGSGYALDFDGVNDYVDLDTHAQNLGFNKTDDLNFSFYFKTTSTDLGRIYSTSYNWGTNPEFQIFLSSNGTIAAKFEVTSCGFTVYSDGTYNDGDWYYVEIWYNGITAEPTVTIYVDGEFDGNITHWVCPFTNDEFTRTKIGRRSHNSSDFFDGKIDEFKIIKYAGGNKQNSPEISGPTSGEPGVEYDFTFVTNDPEEDDIWLYIDWNDSEIEDWIGPYESGEEVTVSHTWDENGSYRIKAKSKDVWDDSYWSYHTIIIGNQPPYAPNITGPQFGDVGELLEYTFNATDYEGNEIKLYIDWNDGEVEDWIGPFESGEEVKVNHTWMEKGKYEIKAKAKDSTGEGNWSEPYLVVIGNEPPDPPTITGPTKGEKGEEYNYAFVTTDPEGDNVYYWIDWGDGTVEENGWVGPYASDDKIIRSHSWEKIGKYNIKAKAKDIYDAESNWSTLKVTMPENQISQISSQQYSKQLYLKILGETAIRSQMIARLLGL